jgi:hypothetical protein
MARLNAVTGETYVTLEYIRVIVLEDFSSLFNSELLLWTPFKARSLEKRIEPTPGASISDIVQMLEGADDEVIQLCAELLFIQQLFSKNLSAQQKLENVRAILEPSIIVPEIPGWVTDERPGNFVDDPSFEHHRLFHLDWLLKFVGEWHRSGSDRNALLRDPWKFREMVSELDSTPESDSIRNAWLHIIFPDTFENVTSSAEKFRIREKFLGRIDGVRGDSVDADLLKIRAALSAELGSDFDFNDPAVANIATPHESAALDSPGTESVDVTIETQPVAAQLPPPTVADTATQQQRPTLPRREIFALLQRDELLEVVEKTEIKANRRSNEKMIGALADSSKVQIPDILPLLSRDTLKGICELLQLDTRGREKAPLIDRILVACGEPPPDRTVEAAPDETATLARLLPTELVILESAHGWPVRGELRLKAPPHPVDIYIAAMSNASGTERTFKNPAQRPIVDDPDRHEILLGIWNEQGDDRAVLVAFDVGSKRNRSARFSASVSLQLLEQAADTGYATQEIARDEMLYAFRPDNLSRYFEILKDSPLKLDERPAKKAAASEGRRTRSSGEKPERSRIYIRPQVGMYAAFARLNYKPWFALAEFLDNSIQSFLNNRGRLEAAGQQGPLVIDVNIDDNEISITDRAGGIALADFPRAFSPAAPPDDPSGLSEFGLGMKAAACWFARKWNVRTSALGDPIERVVSFDIPKITKEGLENLPIEARPSRESDHFTVITMHDLRVQPRGKTRNKIRDHLSSIYRVLTKENIVLIRLTVEGRTEELVYEPPDLLEAPFFRDPTGPVVLWRKDINVDLGARKVRGWAGIMKSGGYARAGFSVFRRRRLIEGSVGETYKPSTIFRSPNSFSSQRIVGELFVEGFDVTHTKDGIQWHGYEDEVLDNIRQQLNDDPMRLLDQAEGYRAKRVAASLPKEFGTDALRATVAALSTPAAVDVLRTATLVDEPAAAPSQPTVHQQRVFKLQVIRDGRSWDIHLELVSDPAMHFYSTSTISEAGHDVIKVQVNLDHAFSIGHINDNETSLSPVLRLVAALALAEKIARDQGVKSAGAIRANTNEILGAIAGEPSH